MKLKRIFVFTLVVMLIATFIFLVISGFGKTKIASLEVESNSKLPVFVNGKNVGQTPYTGTYEPKPVTLQIGDYETQVNLEPTVKTIVRRDFDENNMSLSGEVVSFEKIVGKDAILAVVTNPDKNQVKVDGNVYGNSPINVTLPAGTHQLEVGLHGYNVIKIPVNMVSGYKLTAVVDLAPVVPKPAAAQDKTQDNLNQAMVTILATPNGFLRVRSAPDTASTEVAEVHASEKYPLIKTDAKSGWYDIQLTASVSGWVSNIYSVLK